MLHEIARLVASLHRDDGGVAVEGFYAGSAPPTVKQRADTAAFPYDEAAFFADVGGSSHGEDGYTPRERVTLRSALDVNGLWGGYTGDGGKTIVLCEAGAKLTVRIVEGQDPVAVLKAVLQHLRQRCPAGCTLEVIAKNDGSPASSLAPDHPLVRAAEGIVFQSAVLLAWRTVLDNILLQAEVLARESGQQAIHVRLGATVPITAIFKQTLGIDTLMFGYNLPDEDVHAPNEFFRLKSIQEGARAWTQLLAELGKCAPASFHQTAQSA